MRPRSISLTLALSLGAAVARADAPPADAADVPSDSGVERPFLGVERPWLYAADPTGPPAGHVIASTTVGYAQVDRGAARPFAADVAHAGAVFGAGAELGIVRSLSASAEGLISGRGAAETVGVGAMAGINYYPLAASSPIDVAVSAGWLRELGGGHGAWARTSVGGDLGRARLVLSALGEHVFEPGRDGVDVMLQSAAGYRLMPWLFVGGEYVVQDLEGAWDPEEADGGIRHFLGPTVALELADDRVRIAAGPALGLSEASPRLLGRLTATFTF